VFLRNCEKEKDIWGVSGSNPFECTTIKTDQVNCSNPSSW